MARLTLWRGHSAGYKIAAIGIGMTVATIALLVAALLTETHSAEQEAERAKAHQPVLADPQPALTDLPADAPLPDPTALAAILDPIAAAGPIGDLSGIVLDNETGEALWRKDPDRARTPASTTKVLTGLAAHLAVPAAARLQTTLAEGEAGELVVVPGGNVTTAAGKKSAIYPGADTLAQYVEIAQASGVHWNRVTVAPGPYEGPDMARGWNLADIAGGYLTRAQPWMLDGGRLDGTETESPRENEPMLAAAIALAQQLGVAEENVSIANTPVPVSRELGVVESGTLNERSRAISMDSDNVGADALCHEVAMHRSGIAEQPPIADGHAGWDDSAVQVSIAESTDAVLETLREAGIDTGNTQLDDCSGMSSRNHISPRVLADAIRYAARPEADADARALLDTFPVAAGSGTLRDRFGQGTAAAPGAGWVRAKTGTLMGVSTLAGVVTTNEGRSLTFALMSEGTNPADARPWLDRIAAELRGCGCR